MIFFQSKASRCVNRDTVTVIETKIRNITDGSRDAHLRRLVFNLPHMRHPRVSVTEELGTVTRESL